MSQGRRARIIASLTHTMDSLREESEWLLCPTPLADRFHLIGSRTKCCCSTLQTGTGMEPCTFPGTFPYPFAEIRKNANAFISQLKPDSFSSTFGAGWEGYFIIGHKMPFLPSLNKRS